MTFNAFLLMNLLWVVALHPGPGTSQQFGLAGNIDTRESSGAGQGVWLSRPWFRLISPQAASFGHMMCVYGGALGQRKARGRIWLLSKCIN